MRATHSKLAAEMLLTSKPISAHEAKDRFGIVNRVVRKAFCFTTLCCSTDHFVYALASDKVLSTALAIAQDICKGSPDSILHTKAAMNIVLHDGLGDNSSVGKAAMDPSFDAMYSGSNMAEGLRSFSEVRGLH